MLYLVKLDSCYKIGYSIDVEKRIKQLSPTHIDVELISTKFGNQKDEKELHSLCQEYKIKNELFQIDINVEKIFNKYISKYLQDNIREITKSYKEQITLYKKLVSNYELILEYNNIRTE